MRCLSLAGALRQRGVTSVFVCRADDGHLCSVIERESFTVIQLPRAMTADALSDADEGSLWTIDAQQTADAVRRLGARCDLLIVDHYGLDARWERALRPLTDRVMAIDDLADRAHDCDVLLDQNLVADIDRRYIGRLPANSITLLGPQYALLQPTYSALHDAAVPREGPVQRILVFFSGADRANLTERTVRALLSLDLTHVHVDVAVAGSTAAADSLTPLVVGRENFTLQRNLPSLGQLMIEADLAVGGAGATSWERLCVGLPAVVVTLAANQEPVAAELNRRQLIWWIGNTENVDEAMLANIMQQRIAEGCDTDKSRRGRMIVDGRGADRVCDVLLAPKVALCARPVRPNDEALLLAWANDPVTRRSSFHQHVITPEAHAAWFRARTQDTEGCRMYVVEDSSHAPVGLVRFERADNVWTVSYSLAPAFRGVGLGRPLLDAGLAALRAVSEGPIVTGTVKADNVPSCRIFAALGFRQTRIGDIVEFRRAF
jgi:UDP-2,4-diacetamido-2,4,6-trideoxy-beta-L-altropyranose hydrolase